MPLYAYRCEKGHEFDALQSITAEPLTECEQCDAAVRRVLQPPAIRLHGKGFHNTDYPAGRRGRKAATS